MSSNGLVDEQLDIMCDGFFDNIDDLLDFPEDDEAFQMVNSPVDGSKQIESVAFLTPIGGGCQVTTNSEKNKLDGSNISEDWISKFLSDTYFEIELPANNTNISTSYNDYLDKDRSLFQSFSPISVLESSNLISNGNSGSSSSSSCSSNSVSLAPVGPAMIPVPAKARTNRPRRPAQSLNAIMLSECDNIAEESCPKTIRKKMKVSIAAPNASAEDPTSVRKCMHCGLQKTPQWRAGPMGPKTLCNACGVRYRSGRLYPEYRPAASPTFVPALHSNSHKKVVEMRNKAGQKNAMKNCDLLEYIRRRDEFNSF